MTIDRKNGTRRGPPWSNPSAEPASGEPLATSKRARPLDRRGVAIFRHVLSRRRFLGGVLAAAGAAVTARAIAPASEPPRATARTRWIGHC